MLRYVADAHQPEPFVAIDDITQQLATAIPRVDALDHLRVERALSSQSAEFQHVFELIPLLIHLNHPALPAYLENAPNGITHFKANAYQQRYLLSLTDVDIDWDIPFEQNNFDALYAMGSTGSITQTSLSDLDLWLCHDDRLTPAQHLLIEKKLTKIQLWAKCFDVEVNFYLMNPERFKQNQHACCGVTDEHSGSAQYCFLLDEFYRSAIRLAGKRLLWWHLADDHNYAERIQQAVKKGQLTFRDWVDFGDLSTLSTNEFFGAGLWQLYKGINSPYKSAIKILLLESYTESYPAPPFISKKFKQQLLTNSSVNYHFDPYLAMLEQVTDYLKKRNEWERLDLLHRCFYIKASEGQAHQTWRRKKLQTLVEEWGWQINEIKLMDNRAEWKVKQAMAQQQMLQELLLQSYRHLIHFARKFKIDPSIMPHDADILMRKLYSAFEVLPGKVTLINPNIAQNLAEKAITLIEVSEGCALKSGWYLVNQAPKSEYNSAYRYVQQNASLNKLVAWGYFNGIITANTQLHIMSKNVDQLKIRQFITDLRLSFPRKAPQITTEELHHPNEIRNLILVVNLVKDPTVKLEGIRRQVSPSDLFNFGSNQESLVGSVSITYRNVWNEIRTHHFEGNDAILKALKVISNKIYLSSAPPQSVNVFCYSRYLKSELRDFIADLVNRCITVQTGTIFQKQQLSTLKVAGKTWQLVFGKQQLAILEVPEQAVRFSSNKTETPPPFPRQIDEFASEGFLQFFFEDTANGNFNVYILDEQNSIESYFDCEGSKIEKIKEINRLHTQQKQNLTESFNYPQYYQLITYDNQQKIVPFQSRQHLNSLST